MFFDSESVFLWPWVGGVHPSNTTATTKSSLITKIEILMYSVSNVFLTSVVFLWPGGGGTSPLPRPSLNHHSTRESRFRYFYRKCFFDRRNVRLTHGVGHFPLVLPAVPPHENRDFNIFYKKCSFDPPDIEASKQANKQFILARLFSTRKRILWTRRYAYWTAKKAEVQSIIEYFLEKLTHFV